MLTDCSGHPVSTARVVLIWCNVVANIYHFIIISLIDESEIELLLGNHYKVKEMIIMLQTIVLIWAITFSILQKQSRSIFSIKFWILKLTLAFLLVDIMIAYETAVVDLLSHETTLNDFWKIKTHCKESVAPDKLYYIVAVVLTIYLVFKSIITYHIYDMGRNRRDDLFNDEYLLHRDIERNNPSDQTISSDLPPSYDECVTAEAPPLLHC